ncbi:hypothetical protein [Mycolicibacterium thermoresistibile]
MTSGRDDEPVARPDTDDYDLLTFGEVAARLSEELTETKAELAAARSQEPPDPERIRRIEQRIALLTESGNRYRQEQRTNELFTRRFGQIPPGEGPSWQ